MFLAGGVCLCLLQALADRPLPLGPAAAVGAAGVSGLSWPSAQSAAACCTPPSGITTSGAIWPAGLPQIHRLLVLLCGWVVFVLRGVESTVYRPQNPPPGIKVKLSYCLSGIIKAWKAKPDRKAVHTMTQQFRYVGGHIEVFSENGEFLFSRHHAGGMGGTVRVMRTLATSVCTLCRNSLKYTNNFVSLYKMQLAKVRPFAYNKDRRGQRKPRNT